MQTERCVRVRAGFRGARGGGRLGGNIAHSRQIRTRGLPRQGLGACDRRCDPLEGSAMSETRRMWSLPEVRQIHDLPLTDLISRAQEVHRAHHQPDAVQLCTLLSIKTGGCPEDCGYCPQSAHYKTGTKAEAL